MYRPFTVTWEAVVPGAPLQVWDAITRRSASWIWEIEYEPREGGAERGLTGGDGVVTAWEPGEHFQTRAERPDGWTNQLDYRLEPHPDGTLVRYRHDGVGEQSEWHDIYEGCVQHTDFYRHSMSEYVRWFSGRDATYVGVDADGTFADVTARLGLPDGARVGDEVRLQAAGLDPIEGTIDYLSGTFLGVRNADQLFRVYGRDPWNAPLGIAQHLFGQDVDVAARERAWKQWMNTTKAVA